MSVDRAELLVAAGNAYLAGGLDARRAERAFTLRSDRHSPVLAAILAGVDRLRVAGAERAVVLRDGSWREWTPEAEFAFGRWRVTWREADGEEPPVPALADAGEALAAELDAALGALPAAAREARVLLTARATLRGEPSPTASPIRRLRAGLGQGPPAAPRAAQIAGGTLPAAYPEPARRLFRAAVEAERVTPVALAARAAALATLP